MAVKSRAGFVDTEKGQEIKQKLQLMTNDDGYTTESKYSANSTLYPDNQISFVDRHMKYLIEHPSLEPDMYLANVRLLTRVR